VLISVSRDERNRLLLKAAMERCHYDKQAAARTLGVAPKTVYRWIEQLEREAQLA